MHSKSLPILSVFFLLLPLLSSCSSGVAITASRLSGIVMDTTIAVEVGRIDGDQGGQFKETLADAIHSNKSFGTSADQPGPGPNAALFIEGTFRPSYEEHHTEKDEGGETKHYIEKTWGAQFEYRITDKETGDLVIDGSLAEGSSSIEEEGRGLFGVIVDIIGALISKDPATVLQGKLAETFVGEISPHEMQVTVMLFEDSDMPELKAGIAHARAGRWKDALGVFLDAKDKYADAKNLDKVYYDAGVAYEYDHLYSYAKEFLERAIEMSPVDEYQYELERCRHYEQEWRWREGYLEKLKMVEKKQ